MRWWSAVLLLAAAGAAHAEDLSAFAFQQRQGAALPWDAPLLDEAGRPATLRQVADGMPVILAPGYFHCPNLCGVVRDDTLAALSHTDLRPGRDYVLVVITIDPAETPHDAARARDDGLARYPVAGAASGWRYLTGPPASLLAVQQAAGFRARFDPTLRQFLHPAGLVLASPSGVVSGYLLGVGYQPADLAASIGRARAGASAWAQPVLLLCFHFDATTGRYSLAAMKLLRLGGVLTVLALGGTLLLAHRGRPT